MGTIKYQLIVMNKRKKPVDLTIKTKYNQNTKFITIHKNLPKVPFYLSVVGGKGSGKTLLIANLVHKYKSIFDKGNIFIFTNSYVPTLNNLTKTREAHLFNSIYDELGNNVVEAIMDYQQEAKRQDHENMENILLIFDDFITDSALNQRRGIFTKLWSMARNFSISLIITSQEYMLIPAPLRKMSDNFIIYKIRNTTEKEQMIKECELFLNEDEFLKVYNYAVKDKYNFLLCMVDENKMLRNFTDEIANEDNGVLI